MSEGTPARLSRKVRRLSPRIAVLTGGALMLAGQALFAVMLLAGGGLPALDASGLLVVPVILIGIALLWLGPVVVALAAGQPVWLGAIALPGAYAVWLLAAIGTVALPDGAVLTIVEGALPVLTFGGALAIVGGGPVWPRLAGVAVIAALAGALGPLAPSTSGAVLIGLVAALGFLAWVSPSANLPRPSTAADRPMRPPTGGR
ncbi:MAG: hypothetical protein EA387_11340 [Nitriliruptor sp.]|nr:MAG: hypothetical protein EA387_11340 [Nitriliruptor sp.]